MSRIFLLLVLAVAACGQPAPTLELRVVAAGEIDPLGGATNVRARLYDEAGGVLTESTFAVAEGTGAFPEVVPFVTARAVVEALDANGDAVARGATRFRYLAGDDLVITVFLAAVDSFFGTIQDNGAETALTAPVVGLTATPLEDGTVLLTGGARLSADGAIVEITDQAWIYDPDTGRYEEIGPMKQARAGHTATSMRPQNGRRIVVLAGGLSVVNQKVQSSFTLELYDPLTRTFTMVPTALEEGRAFHSATLLVDGSVLVAGGVRVTEQALSDGPRWDGLVAASTPLTVVRFTNDPATLTPLANDLDAGRWGHAALRADQQGRVLLVGGRGSDGNALASTTIFTPAGAGGSFSTGPVLAVRRAGVAVARLGDARVLAAGGRSDPDDPATTHGTSEIIDLGTGAASDGPSSTARAYHTATALTGGRVLVAGGIGSDGASRGDAEVYSESAARITTGGSMTARRAWHAAALLPGDMVLLIGGADVDGAAAETLQSGEVYVDPLE